MVKDYREDLKLLLRKLFQFESADLDFGIYRIMNKKRDEIEKFIEKDLIDAVDREFESYNEDYRKKTEKELNEIKSEIIEKLGEDSFELSGEIKKEFINLPISKKYYSKLNEFEKIDLPDQTKAEIFSHIYEFFSRYYEDGDFISLRRYSNDQKYAIPYNGEEVYLYWANFDQYYIKTSENYKNYSFTSGDLKVNFILSDIESAVTNDKEKDRFFILRKENSIDYDNEKNALSIYLEHRNLSEEEKISYTSKTKDTLQKELINIINEKVISNVPEKIRLLLTKKENEKTLLYRHLDKYVKRNTMDYFIHKNIKGFLTRELEYYIKNEVLKLSEAINSNDSIYISYLKKAKIIKNISDKIIEFISQLVEFQKKLFEKKKFVVKTDYVVTLDKIPKDLYPLICYNKAQIEEWKELLKIEDKEPGTLFNYMGNNKIDINPEYLANNKFLPLDTKYFDQNFKDKLLDSFSNIKEEIGGLSIWSDNYQALNLLTSTYSKKIKCIYIDPPYNTETDRKTGKFLYKDNFINSTWIGLIENRITVSYKLMNEHSTFFCSIDDNEQDNLNLILKKYFNFQRTIPVISNLKGNQDEYAFAGTHEYVITSSFNKGTEETYNEFDLEEEDFEDYSQEDEYGKFKNGAPLMRTGEDGLKQKRPKGWYPIFISPNNEINLYKYNQEDIELYPKTKTGVEMSWRWSPEKLEKDKKEIIVIRNGTDISLYKKQRLELEGLRTTKKPKSVFYKPSYNSGSGTELIKNLFGKRYSITPKPLELIKDIILIGSNPMDIILDFFAGSGTTAHAVLNINENTQSRKYVLIEMGNHFDDLIIPRIKKVVYSSEWKDGIPQNKKGISHLMKYQYLEQYEDSLDNIEFTETKAIQKTLSEMDDYFIKYMLDFETRGSVTRLNIDLMEDPFNYKMKINGKHETVDLIETFNYLLGLHVIRIKAYTYSNIYYRVVYGEKDNEKITVIWRKSKDINLDVDKDFIENTILKDFPPDKIYINGKNFVHKATPIELEFKKQMGA